MKIRDAIRKLFYSEGSTPLPIGISLILFILCVSTSFIENVSFLLKMLYSRHVYFLPVADLGFALN